jgi:hypothetical protein
VLPTLAQAAQCDFSLLSSMTMVDDHVQGCCPSENQETATDCICCDCGFDANSSQTLPIAISISTQKLQELSDLSLIVIAKIEVPNINTSVIFTPQFRAPHVPVYLKNNVFRN